MTTDIVLLGTGTPNAEPDRHGSAVAIVVDGQPYLVDFGPGVVRRATAAGLPVTQLDRAFLTHLHSDHTAGYPDLILTPWVLGREQPLRVWGPPGIQAMTDHLLAAYQADIHERLQGLEPNQSQGYRVQVEEIGRDFKYVDARVQVRAFPVEHGSWPAFGFEFTTAERRIVISGDTRPTDSILPYATGCDVLIHEVYARSGLATRPPDWQTYHTSVHTSSLELAALAQQARPGVLVLVHQLLWGTTEADLLAEIRSVYDGPVIYGRDLDVI
jgi:ribonuclease BN (tRNA processing enzyme)